MRLIRFYLCFLFLRIAQALYPDDGYVAVLFKVAGAPYVPMNYSEHNARLH